MPVGPDIGDDLGRITKVQLRRSPDHGTGLIRQAPSTPPAWERGDFPTDVSDLHDGPGFSARRRTGPRWRCCRIRGGSMAVRRVGRRRPRRWLGHGGCVFPRCLPPRGWTSSAGGPKSSASHRLVPVELMATTALSAVGRYVTTRGPQASAWPAVRSEAVLAASGDHEGAAAAAGAGSVAREP
jgi:hypothetical protein